jgi:phospholipid N-methyltransferase
VRGSMSFIWAALMRQRQTGGIVPSQRFLIAKMIAPVPAAYRGTIIELGAGIGALTVRLAARCPEARILAWEINPALARENVHNLEAAGFGDRVEVITGSAEGLLAEMHRRSIQGVDYVISGVPLANLGSRRALGLLDLVTQALSEGGMYIQFQHSTHHREPIGERFATLRTVPVFMNLPPAVVYYASK